MKRLTYLRHFKKFINTDIGALDQASQHDNMCARDTKTRFLFELYYSFAIRD